MIKALLKIFICIYALLLASLSPPDEKITNVDTKFEQKENQALVSSVEKYLTRFIGKSVSDENRIKAQDFIKTLKFVAQSNCMYTTDASGLKLLCQVISKYTVKNIVFTHTPSSLLEEEIRRKLPLQEGDIIDLDELDKGVLDIIKSRVETFLKKNGYYGSTVEVFKKIHSFSSPYVDISIVISHGAFARVNKVKVVGDLPIEAKKVESKYQRMCLSFDKIIEAMSIGTVSCYSREREDITTQSILNKFAELGYVQARMRVSHYWVDPKDPSAKRACRNLSDDDNTPRCVDLRIEVDKGPKVSWSVNLKDHAASYSNGFLGFVGSVFLIDQFSRASVPNDSDEVALDHVILKNELLKQITFISARNADDQEIEKSVEQMKAYLNKKGLQNVQIDVNVSQDESGINVNFDIYTGGYYFIDSFRVLPDKYLKFIDEDLLNTAVKKRSFLDSGSVSKDEIDQAKDRIAAALQEKGFENIKIKTDISASGNGQVAVVFYVASSERKIVDEVQIQNGVKKIDLLVIKRLINCDNYDEENSNKLCENSSFVAGQVGSDAKRLEEEYRSNNYLYATVKYEVITGEKNKIIFKVYDSRFAEDVTLRQQEIKEIILSGNSSTSSSVIKRLFPYESGSILSPNSLKKGLANIRESRRFAPDIESTILAGEDKSDDVYFALHLTEKRSMFLDGSISFSTDQFFMVEAALEESNLFYSMLRLNTSLGLGLFWGRRSVLSNKLTWPFIFGKHFQLTINAPRIIFEDFTHRPEPSRRLQSKVSFELEWRLSTRIRPYLKYLLIANQEDKSFQINTAKDRFSSLDGLIPTIKQDVELRAVLTPGISYSSLDNPFDPRLGVDSNLWSEISVGDLMGKPSFVNIGVQNRFFIPMGPLTLALQASVIRSFIDPNEHNWNQLKNNSFAVDKLGGDRSVRGYNEAAIGVFELSKNDQAGPFAGYFSNTANVELRFPLTQADSLGYLTGAFFADQGMLFPCQSIVCFFDKKYFRQGFGLSLGAALRYILPVGPISLDYGISPLTGKGRWHILLGYSF